MRITIINGPNLNLLGTREVDIYGNQRFEDYLEILRQEFPEIEFTYYQSNVEGEIINKLQECSTQSDGVVINPAGYSHTSVAIADSIAVVKVPVIEVHISNIYAREAFRHQSLTGAKCAGVISGLGLAGYSLAVRHLYQLHRGA